MLKKNFKMVCSVNFDFKRKPNNNPNNHGVFLGSTKRISNIDIINYLMQPAPKQQLSSMGVENIFPYTGFTEENLREYYENPPAGINIFNY